MWLDLVQEQGVWRVSAVQAQAIPRRLDRKLAAFTPLDRVKPEEVAFVVEAGDQALDEIERIHLAAVLMSRRGTPGGRQAVLIHADPDLTWQGVFYLIDAAYIAGRFDILFTRSGGSAPRPGLRVNGVLLETINEWTDLPLAAEHPVVARVMSILPPD